MTEAVVVSELSKTYRVRCFTGRWWRDLVSVRWQDVPALREVSFTLDQGEAVAYVGPNGAGKSTTIKVLAGILWPTGGRVSVLGLDPFRSRMSVARLLGIVFGQRTQLWWELPVIESYRMLALVYDVPEHRFRSRLDRIADMLDLGPLLHRPVRTLSLGEKMRAELGSVLLHSPRLLLLDEPTLGVDLLTKHNIRRFLIELRREEQVTIFLATHDLSDVEAVCDRIIVLNRGQIVLDGGLPDLLRSWGHELEVQFADGTLDVRTVAQAVKAPVSGGGSRFTVRLVGRMEMPAVVERLLQLGQLVDIKVKAPSLEAIITSLYTSSQGEQAPCTDGQG